MTSAESTKALAHIREGAEETVKEHLEKVANLAKEYAAIFESGDTAFLAGLFHDIGKYSSVFQKRLLYNGPAVDHSTPGAIEVKSLSLSAAYAIMGHHGGIPNSGTRGDKCGEETFYKRIKKKFIESSDYSLWKREIALPAKPILPNWVCDNVSFLFYTRMIFSCLVDADYLKTEEFMNGAPLPRGEYESLECLHEKMQKKALEFYDLERRSLDDADKTPEEKLLIQKKNDVLRACIENGKNFEKGLYTLTVPTGGGKTFSSLAFVLEHAMKHTISRIIYVIPYTSIIDQTADFFEKILGAKNVLPHHSGAEYLMKDNGKDNLTSDDMRRSWAAENRDAPIIVTTSVQFFESIYSNKPSRCRKLHNIANSVIIFDEAQTIPANLLESCVSVIAQLVKNYGVTAVLCTATQPTLQSYFAAEGCNDICEIYPQSEDLYALLKRTTILDLGDDLTYDIIADRIKNTEQTLCVVNLKDSAPEIYERLTKQSELSEEECFCLTTHLCSTDRKLQLDKIRRRLKEGLPCRVVSTSLIEAGVDVDFPVVYREYAGLDSILQAAGRCNRHGTKSAADSPAYIFGLDGAKNAHTTSQNISAFRTVKKNHPNELDAPAAVEEYFREAYNIKNTDVKNIMKWSKKGFDGSQFPFKKIADEYRLIDQNTRTVYIPLEYSCNDAFPTDRELCERLRNGERGRVLFRALGMYSVEVYESQLKELRRVGVVDCFEDGDFAILSDNFRDSYSSKTGLCIHAEGGIAFFDE
ncbi:MAG: CRISPR-associated helicase Cas3' [Firmicutes bacterium]|nr:CRISPR-associated helicase Cas3' [Bacillota bacterium]